MEQRRTHHYSNQSFVSSFSKVVIVVRLFINLLLSSAFTTVNAMSTSSAASSGSSAAKKGALIFLHGLGDTPAGWSSLERVLPSIRPRLRNIEYVFPPAPTIPITINGGMTMPGWFDLYDWPIGIQAKEDKVGLQRSVKQLNEVVKDLQTKSNIDKNRIVLGGFSQGGAIALLTAYGYPLVEQNSSTTTCSSECFAGCAALSGWIPTPDNWNISLEVAKTTKLFWAHGTFDDKVLFEQQSHGLERLEQMGIPTEKVEHQQYHMGHESDPKELEELAKFLDDILFGDDDTKEES